MDLKFEWDQYKARLNIEKHSISFEEAKTVFDDEAHSICEKREIIIGQSINNRLLLVYFVETSSNIIRIFSSRLATNKERRDYEENILV